MRSSGGLLTASAMLLLGALIASGQIMDNAPDLTTIDTQIALYLRLEKALWQVVRNGRDEADKLRRIHETHLTLLASDFAEKGIQLNPLDVDQRELFRQMNNANRSAQIARDVYLHAQAGDRKRDEAVRFASHSANMSRIMEQLFNVTETTDFYQYVARKGELQSCELTFARTVQSAHQQIYDHYHDVTVAQLKSYAVTQIAYMFNTVYGVRASHDLADRLRTAFMQRNARARQRVRQLLETASRSVWVCDPDDPRPMAHADQLTRLLQGYVENEVTLNNTNDCKKTCPDYVETRSFLPDTDAGRCGGTVHECDFIGSDMDICPSNDPFRRYDGIAYTSGQTLGTGAAGCTVPQRVSSWTRWLVHCSQCFCLCDERGPHSDRYFSLRPVVSDLKQNKVITGVALRKINRMFVWLIAERPLLANGEVSPAASAPNTDYALRNTFRLNDPYAQDGVDYHTLSHQNRTVNLDQLIVPDGSVCTGVRFAVDQGSLKLEIRATAFHFKTGQLSQRPEDSRWLSNTIYQKTPINLAESLRVPSAALSKSVPDVRPNKFVEFTASDRATDVAQSTVPFIDTQQVQPDRPVPLAGIGLYYKGLPGFGGYVAPKLLTFDYRPYINNM